MSVPPPFDLLAPPTRRQHAARVPDRARGGGRSWKRRRAGEDMLRLQRARRDARPRADAARAAGELLRTGHAPDRDRRARRQPTPRAASRPAPPQPPPRRPAQQGIEGWLWTAPAARRSPCSATPRRTSRFVFSPPLTGDDDRDGLRRRTSPISPSARRSGSRPCSGCSSASRGRGRARERLRPLRPAAAA